MTSGELNSQIMALEEEIQSLDVLQKAYKLMMNSLYGGIISPKNPINDSDLGNAITRSGMESIKTINRLAKKFVRDKVAVTLEEKAAQGDDDARRELIFIDSKGKFDDVIVRNATDSAMLSLTKCGVKMFDGDKVTPDGYALIDELGEYLNDSFQKWYCESLGTKRCYIRFKREKICDVGLWLEGATTGEAAKNSCVLHVLDNEGNTDPKFEYTGVKVQTSTIHKNLKDKGKEIIEHMILDRDFQENDRMVRQLFVDFKNLPTIDKSIIARCSKMKQYDNTGMSGYVPKTPGHVKAALNYNKMIDELGLSKYQKIKAGDLIHVVHLERNRYHFETMAFHDEWPEEFNKIFKIDNNTLFEKSIFREIRRFYKSVGWEAFNPADGYAFSLFDFADMFGKDD